MVIGFIPTLQMSRGLGEEGTHIAKPKLSPTFFLPNRKH
jgi:hypothetical protein